jgi:glucosylglycerate synthase
MVRSHRTPRAGSLSRPSRTRERFPARRYVVEAVLDPSRAAEALAAEVVVGLASDGRRDAANEAALALQAGLRAAFPERPSIAVVLAANPAGTLEPGAPLVPAAEGSPAPAVHTGAGGPEAALHALLDIANERRAPACALLEPMPRPADPGWLRTLLDPVLSGAVDLVAPSYARRRFDGVLVSGLVYPLTRALFGQRIRQPLGTEMVLSRRLVEQLSADDAWRTDPAHAGSELWVIARALVRECRCAQVFLGPRPVPQAQPADVADALATVLGTLFHEMDLHAARWQRVRGSCPVATYGDEQLPGDTAPPPAPAPLVAAFDLGWRDLRSLWSAILPPNTMLALQRIPRDPPQALRMPDAIWARVVYDFAVGWRVKVMDRLQLLHSLTPIYMGWLASFVNEVAELDRVRTEERIERLAAAYEAEKPYLISRWRWPDRFTP